MTSILHRVCMFALACLFVSGAASFAQARPFHHPFGELREYHRHWLAVCPDVHKPASQSEYQTDCWASTWTGNDNGTFTGAFPGNRLTVRRNRKTGHMAITFVSESLERIDQTRVVQVRFSNGSILKFPYGSRVTPNRNSGNEYTFSLKADTADLLRRMKAGNHVTITLPMKEGDDSVMFYSLVGLKSALGFLQKYADR